MSERFTGDRRDGFSFDRWLAVEFIEQYDRQRQIFNRLGLLDILPEAGETGIIGIDNREYPIPSREEIVRELKGERREIYETKLSQGFTRFQLTPFGLPLNNLIAVLERQLKEHFKQSKLLATKEHPDDPDEPMNLDTNQPVWVWDEWRGSDQDGSAVYYPASFDQTNHGGHTKAEILKAQSGSPFAGWNPLLLEPSMNIPRQGKGKTIGSRKQLEANRTPAEYRQDLSTNSQYASEQGLTNEDWLTLFIAYLRETNQVIDDWQGKGNACYLTGSFKPSSRHLGYGCWSRGSRQAHLAGDGPGDRYESNGLRPAVGLGQKLAFEI